MLRGAARHDEMATPSKPAQKPHAPSKGRGPVQRAIRRVFMASGAAAIQNPTAAITVYRRFDKRALGPLGDSLGDFR
jgi:hypothetical protein